LKLNQTGTEEENMFEHFKSCGKVSSVNVIRKNQQCCGIAFITFEVSVSQLIAMLAIRPDEYHLWAKIYFSTIRHS